MLKSVSKGQWIVATIISGILAFKRILVVVYVLTNPMPAKFWVTFTRADWITEDPHTVIVERIWFRQVKYIEFDCVTLERICNSEEVPLGVTICVDIILKYEVILLITNFHCSKQIPSLEPRLKNESFVIRSLRHIVGRRRETCFTNFLWLCRLKPIEVFRFTLDVMISDQLLNINQISCDLSHRLR